MSNHLHSFAFRGSAAGVANTGSASSRGRAAVRGWDEQGKKEREDRERLKQLAIEREVKRIDDIAKQNDIRRKTRVKEEERRVAAA